MWHVQNAILKEIEKQPTISQSVLSDLMFIGIASVQRHLRRLERLGVISKSNANGQILTYTINYAEAKRLNLL